MKIDLEHVQRLAAFSFGASGGNPAGVVIADGPVSDENMQEIAKAVNYSETVFAWSERERFTVRYFSPEAEVPFCGHATIALGAALAQRFGRGKYALDLKRGAISVEGWQDGELYASRLTSLPTSSALAPAPVVEQALQLFGYTQADLNQRIPPAVINAGNDHLCLILNSRETLRQLTYQFEAGQRLMRDQGWVTILVGYPENDQLFHTRNPFAYGGVYEDAATGASTAALAGYLRDLQWDHRGRLSVHQGDDMGVPCRLHVEMPYELGSPVLLSGTVREI